MPAQSNDYSCDEYDVYPGFSLNEDYESLYDDDFSSTAEENCNFFFGEEMNVHDIPSYKKFTMCPALLPVHLPSLNKKSVSREMIILSRDQTPKTPICVQDRIQIILPRFPKCRTRNISSISSIRCPSPCPCPPPSENSNDFDSDFDSDSDSDDDFEIIIDQKKIKENLLEKKNLREMKRIEKNPLYKTRFCISLKNPSVPCPYGQHCVFAHSKEEIRCAGQLEVLEKRSRQVESPNKISKEQLEYAARGFAAWKREQALKEQAKNEEIVLKIPLSCLDVTLKTINDEFGNGRNIRLVIY